MARDNPIDLHVGRRVRMRRMLIGMSQTELADRLGLTFQQIQKYEKGMNRIGASRMFEIGQVLRVSPAYFFEGLEGESMGEAADVASEEDLVSLEALQAIATRQGIELNRAFLKLRNPKIRRLIIDLVDSIAEEYGTDPLPRRGRDSNDPS
ncbi:MAG: helix-turn-helix domain-containing protein [Alphaproteobacteria bacterium]